ncbi:MAG: hypothetical protein C5B54_09625, partial [Acidobacteria bacterium]
MNTPGTDSSRWKQLDQLLDAVLDLPAEERPAYLDDACAGDTELRKEIDELLRLAYRARSFIESPAFQESSSLGSSSNLASLLTHTPHGKLLRAGKLIAGRYEILSRLGKGGMGEVWHAFDIKLRVDVALKSLRRDLYQTQDPLELIRREVRIAREVISPNVCRIFDLVSEEDYELISMEHIDGITLTQMMEQEGPLLLRDARDIAAQFLAGLDAIHSAGLVHRDLKPENIMITRTGRVVVMDLGIAQPQAHADGIISGTLPYMSPEQKAGQQIDARSDIYAAGVVLAEMIHARGVQNKTTREQIWHAIRDDPTQLPESAWKEVIARAVAVNKEDRFESATSLAHALEESTLRTERIEDRMPYPGLGSFSSGDSDYFFGREQEVETLIKKLQQLHMLALIGPSGAGKTSFLQAGLIPALPKEWGYALVHPGGAPMVNLQQAVTASLSADEEARERIARFEDADTAIWILSRLRQTHPEFVIIVDRFEELFTLSSREVQTRFTEFLGRATLEANVRILLAMRDDFFIFCKEHPPLLPIFSYVTPMLPLTGASLRRALVQPALKCGYKFEDETLLHDILSDVEKERGALPLLAFAASLLWEKRDRTAGKLTRKAYEEIGEVRGALAQHAENTMRQIGAEKEPIVREIFRNLITAQNTRVARDTEDLLSVFEATHFSAGEETFSAGLILRILIDARLLTSFENRMEITHESLISNWPRLVKWRAQDAESAQMRDELRQAAQLWNQKGRPVDLLWTGAAFLEFQIWRERYPGRLTATENAFAEAMTLHATRTRRRRRMIVTATIIVLLIALAVIANFWHNSVIEAKLAQASKLLVIGRSLPEADRKTKLAYAITSLEISDTVDARRFAMQILSEVAPPLVVTPKFRFSLSAGFFSPDDKLFASIVGSELRLFSKDSSPPVLVSNDLDVSSAQFTKDSKFLVWVSATNPRSIQIWSLAQKKIVRTISMPGYTRLFDSRAADIYFITDATGTVKSIFRSKEPWTETDFNVLESGESNLRLISHWPKPPRGGLAVARAGDAMVIRKPDGIYLQNLGPSGVGSEKLIVQIDPKTQLCGLEFHPNGKYIAVCQNGATQLYALDSPLAAPVRSFAATGPTYFDSSGHYLVIGNLLWNLSASLEAEPVAIQHPLGEEMTDLSFDHQGRWMAVSWAGSLEFYPLSGNGPFVYKEPAGGSSYIRFTPDGKSFIDGQDNQGLRIHSMWNESPPSRTLWKMDFMGGYSTYFDLDPSGKH